jgi:excisionase family DNA binding protein
MSNEVGKVLRARQLTVVETAVRLGLKPSTVRKLILTRRIGFTKIGRAVRIPETELERIIEAGFRPAIQL